MMDPARIISFARQALLLCMLLSAPAGLAALTIGLLVGILQSATQIQENTLTFVPKVVAITLALLLAGGWMGTQILQFTHSIFSRFPFLVR